MNFISNRSVAAEYGISKLPTGDLSNENQWELRIFLLISWYFIKKPKIIESNLNI